ncbi:hypothetical protein HNR46_003455 [Haloferula luteola]|uniref:Uncharacterized protein n=1 Tax=Haloferula luteola TaxID=595692 RepID=A0A840VKL1_9BACT|nr:hypothetical protein [Haloferula luteola]
MLQYRFAAFRRTFRGIIRSHDRNSERGTWFVKVVFLITQNRGGFVTKLDE